MEAELIPCPHCGLKIRSDSERCLYCRQEITWQNSAHKIPPPDSLEGFKPQPKQNLLWAGLGVLAAGLLVPLGRALILIPFESARLAGGDTGNVSLAFSLLGCIFGIFLAPLAGLLGGRAGFKLRNSSAYGILGALLGGTIYAFLVLLFGLLNLILTT